MLWSLLIRSVFRHAVKYVINKELQISSFYSYKMFCLEQKVSQIWKNTSLLFTNKHRAIKTGADMHYSPSKKLQFPKQHYCGYDESPPGGKGILSVKSNERF
jgi:hypothetical protein